VYVKLIDCLHKPRKSLVLVYVGKSDHKYIISLWSRLCPVLTYLVIFLTCRNAVNFLGESWKFPGLLNCIVHMGEYCTMPPSYWKLQS